MSKKRIVAVCSLSSGKYDVSVGSDNGLAIREGDKWVLSPNLRNIPKATAEDLLKRLDEASALTASKQG